MYTPLSGMARHQTRMCAASALPVAANADLQSWSTVFGASRAPGCAAPFQNKGAAKG